MQIYAISVLLLAANALSLYTASGKNPSEATTLVNDEDNAVYTVNETPSPLPQIPENIKPTRCFSHPPEQEIDSVNTNNVDPLPNLQEHPGSDPIPPEFHTFPPFQPIENNIAPSPFGYRNYYNQPSFAPPPPFIPFQRFAVPNQQPLVIVKLLQPIILPVAKPMYPESGENSPDDSDSERFTNNVGFLRGRGFNNRFGGKRFAPERYRNFERPMPLRQQSFGPYKVGNEDNIQISVKLH